ncbi:HupE/UreJ family protein [Mangrovimicrobium sediminis]|uniref:HupE/UreJ family protein n=1 Tax=Mangrovimicrobium sediminis TaxID=2562682 RepID=A0A4Z0LUG2_9GAMM|nr:HupE/UreJ family protein [Haliea sp. SAOS-164]TGD70942.1 HupE/UreJ family protein [Haliea sp. SAOS-164]
MAGRYRWLSRCLLLWTCLLGSGAAHSHETPVALLTIKEGIAGTYWLEWTYYSSRNDVPPQVRWPGHCFEDYPRLECGEQGLVGEVVMPEIGDKYSAAVVQVRRQGAAPRSYTLTGGNPRMVVTADGTVPWQTIAAAYIPLGIEHIMLGVDHLLFVLGLLLLVHGTRSLVTTITSFTVAHSITLAAATLGWVGIPDKPVNACIALSIVVVVVEVIKHRRGEHCLSARLPWLIAFGFGLLHGFGFAGAMSNVGLPPESLPAALLFFNVGVEVGQLAFVLTVLGLYHAHRVLQARLPAWCSQAGIYGVGSIASYWFIGRFAALLAT